MRFVDSVGRGWEIWAALKRCRKGVIEKEDPRTLVVCGGVKCRRRQSRGWRGGGVKRLGGSVRFRLEHN